MTAEAQKKHRHRPSQELRITRGAIRRDWEGATVAIIAGGWSLTKSQVATARAWRHAGGEPRIVMGVNDAYRLAPWIDALYAADPQWWTMHIRAVRDCYIPQMMSQDESAAEQWGLRYTPGVDKHGLSFDPNVIHYGGNSGFQALNIAVLSGARRVVLLGYNMSAPDDKPVHWFGDHPAGLSTNRSYPNYVKNFDRAAKQLLARKIEVVNATPNSALQCFPVATASDALFAPPDYGWNV